ncbi:MAG: hypothetical protein M3171_04750, partial [Actinomycetota bacterium]|nr:hypothetical protein [Actinomycetota bacterium]
MAGMAGMDMSDDHGLVLGAGEAVDLVGGLTFVAELVGVGLVISAQWLVPAYSGCGGEARVAPSTDRTHVVVGSSALRRRKPANS